MPRSKLGAWRLLLVAAFGFAPVGCGPSSTQPDAAPPVPAETARASQASDDSLAQVLAEPAHFDRARRLAALLPTLGRADVPEVRKALAGVTLDLGAAEFELLTRFWAMYEPDEATQWAFGKSPRGYRVTTIVPAVEEWAAREPEGAVNLVRGKILMKADFSDAAEIGLVRGWYRGGLPGLEDYIEGLGLGFERQRALGVYARVRFRRDGSEALESWAEALPDDNERYKLAAFRQVAQTLALFDPAKAIVWCEEHCDGPYGDSTRQLIAQRWAIHDGQAAVLWVSKAPPGKQRDRDRLLWDALRSWSVADHEGLVAFLNGLDISDIPPWFGAGTAMAAALIGSTDPLVGLEWGTRIEEPARRERVMVGIARVWMQRDRAAAEAWLEQSPLSEAARELVRSEKVVVWPRDEDFDGPLPGRS